jgi:hypothetical protein
MFDISPREPLIFLRAAVLVLGPKLPSTAPGVVFHWRGAPIGEYLLQAVDDVARPARSALAAPLGSKSSRNRVPIQELAVLPRGPGINKPGRPFAGSPVKVST